MLLTHFCHLPSLRFARTVQNIWLLISLLQRFFSLKYKTLKQAVEAVHFITIFLRMPVRLHVPSRSLFSEVIRVVTVL